MAKPSKLNLRVIQVPGLKPNYIQLDDHCYIAQKSTFSESGKEYQNTIGHFGKLGICLEAIARDSAKSQSYDSLKEFVERFEQKSEELKNLIRL